MVYDILHRALSIPNSSQIDKNIQRIKYKVYYITDYDSLPFT